MPRIESPARCRAQRRQSESQHLGTLLASSLTARGRAALTSAVQSQIVRLDLECDLACDRIDCDFERVALKGDDLSTTPAEEVVVMVAALAD